MTRYSALFQWKVRLGREREAGREIGRHSIKTHAYRREDGPECKGVDATNLFWGGRNEIKPSEIVPAASPAFCTKYDLDPETMR